MFSAELFAAFAAHHGVLSTSELVALGLSPSQISRGCAKGLLVRIHPQVYRMPAVPEFWLGAARAAALSTKGLISHGSAAYLWGFEERMPDIIEVTVPYERRSDRVGITVHRSTQMALADADEVDGVPVTGLSRTVLDCAATLWPADLSYLVDSVLRANVLDWPDLYDVQIRHSAKGRDGSGKLRTLLDARYGEHRVPDSRWNRMVSDLLIDAGLPEPVAEWEVRSSSGDVIARVDLAYPKQRLAIELDSVRYHFNQASFVRDPRRKNALGLQGWTVLTFTWTDYADNPRLLIETVRKMLTNLNAESR